MDINTDPDYRAADPDMALGSSPDWDTISLGDSAGHSDWWSPGGGLVFG